MIHRDSLYEHAATLEELVRFGIGMCKELVPFLQPSFMELLFFSVLGEAHREVGHALLVVKMRPEAAFSALTNGVCSL